MAYRKKKTLNKFILVKFQHYNGLAIGHYLNTVTFVILVFIYV